MAAIHDAAPAAPALTLAALRQWAIDHESQDLRSFASIDRKLNWLITGIVAVLLTVVGAMAQEQWHEQQLRLQALERPAVAAQAPPR